MIFEIDICAVRLPHPEDVSPQTSPEEVTGFSRLLTQPLWK